MKKNWTSKKIELLPGHILVKGDSMQQTSEHGIVIPDTWGKGGHSLLDSQNSGEVLGVGKGEASFYREGKPDDVVTEDASKAVKKGDRMLFRRHHWRIFDEDSLIGVLHIKNVLCRISP